MIDRICIPVMSNFDLLDGDIENVFEVTSPVICLESVAPDLSSCNTIFNKYSEIYLSHQRQCRILNESL